MWVTWHGLRQSTVVTTVWSHSVHVWSRAVSMLKGVLVDSWKTLCTQPQHRLTTLSLLNPLLAIDLHTELSAGLHCAFPLPNRRFLSTLSSLSLCAFLITNIAVVSSFFHVSLTLRNCAVVTLFLQFSLSIYIFSFYTNLVVSSFSLPLPHSTSHTFFLSLHIFFSIHT